MSLKDPLLILSVAIAILLVCTDSVPMDRLIQEDQTNSKAEPRTSRASETVITVSDDILHRDVTRLGINVGGRSRWGDSITALKNLIPNPGFEAAYMSSNILLRSDGSNSTDMMQDFWNSSWNSEVSGAGQPEDFWNGGEYEFVYGNAKGYSGNITDFHHGNDSQSVSRPIFTIDQGVPVPDDHDVMTVRKKFDSNYLRSINGSACSPWSISGDEDIFFDTGEQRDGTPGEQSARLGTGTRLDLYMDTYYRDGDISCGKGVIVKGDWNISFWAKGQNGGDRLQVRFIRDAVGLTFTSQTVDLSTEWRNFRINFTVAEGVDEDRDYQHGDAMGALDLRFETQGLGNGGNVWLDDTYLGKRNQTNPTVFSDVVVDHLKDLKPGILRGWFGQLGVNLEEFTDPAAGRRNQGYRIGSRKPDTLSYSAHEFLELAMEVNSSVWLVIPPTLSPQECSDLVDYLGGPISTTYGSKRAVLGQPEPWTEVFSQIKLEFGNELWGGGGGADPFGGASVNGGTRLGAIANDRFAMFRANENYDPDLIKMVIGGQQAVPERQNQIEAASDNHDTTAIGGYYYGSIPSHSSVEEIFGSLYATATEYRTVNSFREGVDNIRTGGHEPAIYEINFHTTDTNDPPEDIRNSVVAGQGGGISLSYSMLTYMKYLGIMDQAAFSSWQYSYRYRSAPSEYVKLWGMLRDLDRTRYKRPTWLSVELANMAIMGDMVNTTHGGADPNWTQLPLNGISQQMEIPYIHSFAFRRETKGSLVLYNLHRTNDLDVKLNILNNPGGAAKKYVMASQDIYDDNEGRLENVSITESDITDFRYDYSMSLPPHSITVLAWEDNAAPVVNFSSFPEGPLALEPVHFNATCHDQDGEMVNWTWDFGDGTGSFYGENVTHSFSDNGNFTVKLTAMDDGGTAVSISRNVIIANIPPNCRAMEDIVDFEDRYVLFTGSGSDTPSDMYSLSYRWNFGDGNESEWQNNVIFGHTYREKGNYSAVLTVADDGGLESSDIVNVTIENHFPTAEIDSPLENLTVTEDDAILFSGVGDDSPSDFASLLFRWDFGDGDSSDWNSSGETVHTYTVSGEFNASLWVMDNNRDTGSDNISVFVENQAPFSDFELEKRTLDEDEVLPVRVGEYNDTPSDVPKLNFTWSANETAFGYGNNASFAWPETGEVTILLRVTDDDGANHTSANEIIILNVPPKALFNVSTREIEPGESILFDAVGSSDTVSDMSSLDYSWTVNGVPAGQGERLTRRFDEKGVFTVKLTVTDNDGAVDTFELPVTVTGEESSSDDETEDRGMRATVWLLLVFAVLVLIIVAGVVLLKYSRKRDMGWRTPRVVEEAGEDGDTETKAEIVEKSGDEDESRAGLEKEVEYDEEGGVEEDEGWFEEGGYGEGWIVDEDEGEVFDGWIEEKEEDGRHDDDEEEFGEGWIDGDVDEEHGEIDGWVEEDGEDGWYDDEEGYGEEWYGDEGELDGWIEEYEENGWNEDHKD